MHIRPDYLITTNIYYLTSNRLTKKEKNLLYWYMFDCTFKFIDYHLVDAIVACYLEKDDSRLGLKVRRKMAFLTSFLFLIISRYSFWLFPLFYVQWYPFFLFSFHWWPNCNAISEHSTWQTFAKKKWSVLLFFWGYYLTGCFKLFIFYF